MSKTRSCDTDNLLDGSKYIKASKERLFKTLAVILVSDFIFYFLFLSFFSFLDIIKLLLVGGITERKIKVYSVFFSVRSLSV